MGKGMNERLNEVVYSLDVDEREIHSVRFNKRSMWEVNGLLSIVRFSHCVAPSNKQELWN